MREKWDILVCWINWMCLGGIFSEKDAPRKAVLSGGIWVVIGNHLPLGKLRLAKSMYEKPYGWFIVYTSHTLYIL